MNVVILSGGIPTSQYPLNGIFAFDQAKALIKIGINVFFLSIDLRSIRRKRPLGVTYGIKDGVKWYNFSFPVGPIKWLLNLVSSYAIVFLYKKVLNESTHIDLIHAHFTNMGYLASILKRKYNIPYVITEHSSDVNKTKISDDLKRRAAIGYQNAERVIAVSSALSKNIKFHTGINSTIIPNIIDTSLFFKCISKKHYGFRLVTTSNLIPLKRTKLILEAICQLDEMKDDLHLDIIGEGPSRQDLDSFVNENKIQDIVTFHGLKKRENISEMYSLADCFVLVSSSETFGVSYVEAMAAGLPVIATRCGGPEDFVDKSNGILIDVDNVNQLKEAILYMYYHHHEYEKQKIKDVVSQKFSPEVVAQQLLSVYEKISNK